ncbi:MAG: aldehyde ferredoxin oxidoreductase family protein [Deltaproteobacteria bacterium]|nr:aldehyde ferredoxin oxidoreductase family protein [Deltaproteobacteria bacterium]
MNGWANKILRVDLSTKKTEKSTMNMDWARAFIGGRGLNSRTLYDEVTPETAPLGPDNVLIFGVGPCNGTLAPGSSSITISTKSPLSGFLGDASTRAVFGAEMKYAGYDQLIIQGKSEAPVYLWIEDDHVEIRDAAHLWGKLVRETMHILEKDNRDPNISVLCIGPGGENLVKFASIMGPMGRAAGRTGVGAVMGSKNLKAIAIRGTKGVKVADHELLETVYKKTRNIWLEDRKDMYDIRKKYGLPSRPVKFQEHGCLSTKNYLEGQFEGFDDLHPERLSKEYYGRLKNCFGCFLPCDRLWVVSRGPYAGSYGAGLEVPQVHHTASRLGISDPDIFFHLDTMLDEYGIDIMDFAGVTGLAIECYLEGIISDADTDGLKLNWGAGEAIVRLLEKIAYRKGIGNILAEGVRGAADIIGQGAEKYALHVKGLTIDGMDPRGVKNWGLGYAVSSRGAEHCRTHSPDIAPDRFVEDNKPPMIKWCEECRGIQHCLEVCYFCWPHYDFKVPDLLAHLYNAVTGVETSGEQLMKVGERVVNLERCFNLRLGLQKSDDTLPDRFTKETLTEGGSKDEVVGIGPMVDKYYKLRGWDVASGFPKRKTLEALGLKEMADDLDSIGKLCK